MEMRRIGSLSVSVVGLGCNNFGGRLDARATDAVASAALDAGINFFDTADIYGDTRSETFLGQSLKNRRDRVVIATKFGMRVDDTRKGAHPDYVRRAAGESLKRLGTDYIDLYQLHEPDATVPIGDTLAALDELVRAGQVREIGCSNFSIAQLQEAERAVADGAARFVSVQNEYSLIHRDPEEGVLEACARLGLAFIPYFPLASGLLTGKYRRGQAPPDGARLASGPRSESMLTDENLALVESLIEFTEQRDHTLLELAMSWLAAQPTVASVIAGATSPEQARANARAAEWRLTSDELAEVNQRLGATADRR
ncbi:MAG: aldo/keto reductase [Gemmatimonadota bacterium]